MPLGSLRAGRQPALSTLRNAAPTYAVDKDGRPLAGRIGLLLMVAAASNDDPRDFGGVDLIALSKQALGR